MREHFYIFFIITFSVIALLTIIILLFTCKNFKSYLHMKKNHNDIIAELSQAQDAIPLSILVILLKQLQADSRKVYQEKIEIIADYIKFSIKDEANRKNAFNALKNFTKKKYMKNQDDSEDTKRMSEIDQLAKSKIKHQPLTPFQSKQNKGELNQNDFAHKIQLEDTAEDLGQCLDYNQKLYALYLMAKIADVDVQINDDEEFNIKLTAIEFGVCDTAINNLIESAKKRHLDDWYHQTFDAVIGMDPDPNCYSNIIKNGNRAINTNNIKTTYYGWIKKLCPFPFLIVTFISIFGLHLKIWYMIFLHAQIFLLLIIYLCMKSPLREKTNVVFLEKAKQNKSLITNFILSAALIINFIIYLVSVSKIGDEVLYSEKIVSEVTAKEAYREKSGSKNNSHYNHYLRFDDQNEIIIERTETDAIGSKNKFVMELLRPFHYVMNDRKSVYISPQLYSDIKTPCQCIIRKEMGYYKDQCQNMHLVEIKEDETTF